MKLLLLHEIFKYLLIEHIVGLELDQTVARLETDTGRCQIIDVIWFFLVALLNLKIKKKRTIEVKVHIEVEVRDEG